jgi:hypothetical protein
MVTRKPRGIDGALLALVAMNCTKRLPGQNDLDHLEDHHKSHRENHNFPRQFWYITLTKPVDK